MLVVKILKSGHVPNHVAFIMDGNRRYANKCNVNSLGGHTKGYLFVTRIKMKYNFNHTFNL